MEEVINKEIPHIIRSIVNLNIKSKDPKKYIKKAIYYLTEQNNYIVNKLYNANLFFHPWIFDDSEYGTNKEVYQSCGESFTKNPYIGLFYPSGGIFCINSCPTLLNNLNRYNQNIHGPRAFSTNECQFYIDETKFGKAYAVCVNDQIINSCRAVPTDEVKGRVELIFYIPPDYEIPEKKTRFRANESSRFIEELLKEEIFSVLFTNYEMEHLGDYANDKYIKKLKITKNYDMHNGLLLMFYQDGTRPDAKLFRNILRINLPIESSYIPFLRNFSEKLPEDLRRKNIIWEFGISIFSNSFNPEDLSVLEQIQKDNDYFI